MYEVHYTLDGQKRWSVVSARSPREARAKLYEKHSGRFVLVSWIVSVSRSAATTPEWDAPDSDVVHCPTCLAPAVAGYDGRCETCWTEAAMNAW